MSWSARKAIIICRSCWRGRRATAARWRPNFRSRTSSASCRRRSPHAIRARGISSFVTVQEGCDKFCTFCVVPYTRGAEVSRPVAKIVDDVLRLADNGVREITLIGQNVNAYHGEGPDGRTWSLGALLRRLADIPGIARLRYSTSHPRDVDDALIAAHRDLPALMPFVHLPVQSGSDRILAAMNRKHTRRRLPPGHRPVPRRPARYCVFIGFYRGLPRRDRGRFRRDPRAGRGKSDTLALIRSSIRRGRARRRRTCGRRCQRLKWTSDWCGSRN